MKNQKVYITARCPIRTALDLLGGKWKLLILFQLAQGPLRPSKLKSLIPDISEKMLIQELKVLVENHLVKRKDYREIPPRVEYSLTDQGCAALPLIEAMKSFSKTYAQLAAD